MNKTEQESVTDAFPILSRIFETAATNREKNAFLGGDRSKGLEQLLDYLNAQEHHFNSVGINYASILIRRSRQDFEVGAECLLSGMYSVTLDLMRDVMEIEFLLRDFRHHTSHSDLWLTCSEQKRRDFFGAAQLRKRYASIMGIKPEDMPDTLDYRVHSMSLHVLPGNPTKLPRGLTEKANPIVREFVFADVFEHGKRLIQELHYLNQRITGEPEALPGDDFLPLVARAWRSTRVLSSVFMEMLSKTEQNLTGDKS